VPGSGVEAWAGADDGAGVMGVVGTIVLAALLAVACCWLASVARPQPHVHGDPQLSAQLAVLAGRRARRVAAAVVEQNTSARIRVAFIRADAETRFEVGSVTKALTGMLLACAIERAEVTMDSTVAEVFPELSDTGLAAVTVRQLCTHCSGLPRLPRSPVLLARVVLSGLLGFDPYRGTSPRGVLRGAARQRLRGTRRYRYSNLGAAVLGQLLAAAAATSYPALLAERILDPLAMSGASVATRRIAARPGWSALGLPRMPWVADGYAPAGGVVVTIEDLARLAAGLLAGTAPGGAAIQPIPDVDLGVPGRRSGMFWVIDQAPGTDRRVIWHNGATGGYSAFMALYPRDGRAVIVLANTARPSDQQHIAFGLARWMATGEANQPHDEVIE